MPVAPSSGQEAAERRQEVWTLGGEESMASSVSYRGALPIKRDATEIPRPGHPLRGQAHSPE